ALPAPGGADQRDAIHVADLEGGVPHRAHGRVTGRERPLEGGCPNEDGALRPAGLGRAAQRSTTRPSTSRTVRSDDAATASLWVTTTTALPPSARSRRSPSTARSDSASTSPVGSSARTTGGSLASATATPAREASPP